MTHILFAKKEVPQKAWHNALIGIMWTQPEPERYQSRPMKMCAIHYVIWKDFMLPNRLIAMAARSWLLEYWDREFESALIHGWLSSSMLCGPAEVESLRRADPPPRVYYRMPNQFII
jgi:hypothetical protein